VPAVIRRTRQFRHSDVLTLNHTVPQLLSTGRRITSDTVVSAHSRASAGRPRESISTSSGSLVLDIGSDTDVHPVATYTALNYDLGKHAPITFDILVKPGTRPLKILNPIVQRTTAQPGYHSPRSPWRRAITAWSPNATADSST
jgi:hypothetical protein